MPNDLNIRPFMVHVKRWGGREGREERIDGGVGRRDGQTQEMSE